MIKYIFPVKCWHNSRLLLRVLKADLVSVSNQTVISFTKALTEVELANIKSKLNLETSPPYEPPRNPLVEIDEIKARVEKLEKK